LNEPEAVGRQAGFSFFPNHLPARAANEPLRLQNQQNELHDQEVDYV
jgi:hypothetical protein